MFVAVDALVLGLTIGLVRAGWRRGFSTAVIDLTSFTAAVALAWVAARPLSEWWMILLSPGWALLAGALTAFLPVVLIAAWFGGRIWRFARRPGLNITDRLLGAAFGLAAAAVLMAFVLAVARTEPVPGFVGDAVGNSPTAQALRRATAPAGTVIDAVAQRGAERLLGGGR